MAILKVRDNDGNVSEIYAIKGDTPKKGVDYFTPEEVAEVVAQASGLPHRGTLTGDVDDANLAQGIYEILIYPAPNGILFGTFINNIVGNEAIGRGGLQIAIAGNADPQPGSMCIRNLSGGGFSEWEWVNPPMTLGVEYRTMEKYQGKPVYTALIDLGTLPNATFKMVMLTDVSPSKILRHSVQCSDGQTRDGVIESIVMPCINITTSTDLSTVTATLQIWYTK